MKSKKLFGVFNIVDIILILAVIVVGAVGAKMDRIGYCLTSVIYAIINQHFNFCRAISYM